MSTFNTQTYLTVGGENKLALEELGFINSKEECIYECIQDAKCKASFKFDTNGQFMSLVNHGHTCKFSHVFKGDSQTKACINLLVANLTPNVASTRIETVSNSDFIADFDLPISQHKMVDLTLGMLPPKRQVKQNSTKILDYQLQGKSIKETIQPLNLLIGLKRDKHLHKTQSSAKSLLNSKPSHNISSSIFRRKKYNQTKDIKVRVGLEKQLSSNKIEFKQAKETKIGKSINLKDFKNSVSDSQNECNDHHWQEITNKGTIYHFGSKTKLNRSSLYNFDCPERIPTEAAIKRVNEIIWECNQPDPFFIPNNELCHFIEGPFESLYSPEQIHFAIYKALTLSSDDFDSANLEARKNLVSKSEFTESELLLLKNNSNNKDYFEFIKTIISKSSFKNADFLPASLTDFLKFLIHIGCFPYSGKVDNHNNCKICHSKIGKTNSKRHMMKCLSLLYDFCLDPLRNHVSILDSCPWQYYCDVCNKYIPLFQKRIHFEIECIGLNWGQNNHFNEKLLTNKSLNLREKAQACEYCRKILTNITPHLTSCKGKIIYDIHSVTITTINEAWSNELKGVQKHKVDIDLTQKCSKLSTVNLFARKSKQKIFLIKKIMRDRVPRKSYKEKQTRSLAYKVEDLPCLERTFLQLPEEVMISTTFEFNYLGDLWDESHNSNTHRIRKEVLKDILMKNVMLKPNFSPSSPDCFKSLYIKYFNRILTTSKDKFLMSILIDNYGQLSVPLKRERLFGQNMDINRPIDWINK